MTLIIATKRADHYVIAADRGVQCGSLRRRLSIPKIWRSGEAIIGGAGHWTHIAAVRNTLPFEGDAYEWAVGALHKCGTVTASLKTAEPDGKVETTPSFVLVTAAGLFEIQDGEVTPLDVDFIAAGMWMFAHGANAVAERMGLAGMERLRAVATAVESVTPDVWGPWDWMATDGTEGTWE